MEATDESPKKKRRLMPQIGFGTYKLGSAATQTCVSLALNCGYRLIDCAQIYNNEKEVGAAIRKSGIPREEIFVISKVWRSKHGYDRTKTSCLQSLKNLGLEYIDLMLVHHPDCTSSGRPMAVDREFVYVDFGE